MKIVCDSCIYVESFVRSNSSNVAVRDRGLS